MVKGMFLVRASSGMAGMSFIGGGRASRWVCSINSGLWKAGGGGRIQPVPISGPRLAHCILGCQDWIERATWIAEGSAMEEAGVAAVPGSGGGTDMKKHRRQAHRKIPDKKNI